MMSPMIPDSSIPDERKKKKKKKMDSLIPDEKEKKKRKTQAKGFVPDALIGEILIRSPARSVGRFRCVCKGWLSLSSHPKFILDHASHAQISAFFGANRNHGFLDSRRPPSYSLPFPDSDLCSAAESSCNGLVLFLFRPQSEKHNPCFSSLLLCNPVTMTSWPAIPPHNDYIWKATLAFDPARSPHFKILALFWGSVPSVAIYSSSTRDWRPIAILDWDISFNSAVYFKGHILWWDKSNACLVCFDVESERFETRIQPPPASKILHYLGPSGGELHFIGWPDASSLRASFDIWQLLPDFSGWSKLCSVNRLDIFNALCRPGGDDIYSQWEKEGDALYFHRGKKGERDQLLMTSQDKLFLYHLQNKTCTILSILSGKVQTKFWWRRVFPYAETIISP